MPKHAAVNGDEYMQEAGIGFAQERTTIGNPSLMNRSSSSSTGNRFARGSWREGLFCALLVGACLLATHPVAEVSFIDDWSYTKTALDFARTGHFLYNGWATAMLGWQVVWGALFIKLFGFSFTVVRLSILPISMASVFLFHRVLVRFGVVPSLAVFGALALGLSPVFIPLEVNFMSDAPGMLVILICIYMCQRAVAAMSDHAALLWLVSAALLNVAGGTTRQIAWLGALVMVPSTAWFLRKRRGIIPAGILAWLISVAAIAACLHWFNQQPYSTSERNISFSVVDLTQMMRLIPLLGKGLLCLLLLLLPALVAWLPGMRGLNRRARIRIAAVMIALAVWSLYIGIRGPLIGPHGPREDEMMPWLVDILGLEGMLHTHSIDMLGTTPVVLGVWARLAISLIVVLAGLNFAEQMLEKKGRPAFSGEESRGSWQESFWLLGPFAVSYFGLLLPRGIHGLLFDRYLLPLVAVLLVVLLKLYQQKGQLKPAAISWVTLVIFAAYSLAATHDWFAMSRARVFAANEIRASGLPRTAIQGGYDYDGWTQVEAAGHVNDPYINEPKGAFNSHTPAPPANLPASCRLWYYPETMPALKPRYFFSYDPMDCLPLSRQYPAVGYHTWLPPYDRKIYIQELSGNVD